MDEAEPKPKRRSALRHALSGSVLLVLLGTGFVLLDRRADSIAGDWCVKAKATLLGSRAIREQVQIGMAAEEVDRWIGFGTLHGWYDTQSPHPTLTTATEFVDYRDYGFRVVYSGHDYKWGHNRTVLAIEDLP